MTAKFDRRTMLAGSASALSTPILMLWPNIAHAAKVGEAAPEIVATADRGKVTLQALRGRLVLLDFWASWCEPCRLSFVWMARMHARYSTRGLSILAVNVDEKRADADRFLSRYPAPFDLAFDPKGQSAERYQIKGMPASVLISSTGEVLQHHHGFRSDDEGPLEAAIVAALPRPAR